MYLHAVYFKGSWIIRSHVICALGWLWHLGTAGLSAVAAAYTLNGRVQRSRGQSLVCWSPATKSAQNELVFTARQPPPCPLTPLPVSCWEESGAAGDGGQRSPLSHILMRRATAVSRGHGTVMDPGVVAEIEKCPHASGPGLHGDLSWKEPSDNTGFPPVNT